MASGIDLRKLPPLKSLKGFEATARLGSVRGAAEELNLTHPAITHQMQVLEADLGVKLFARKGRSLILTPEGERYYPYVLGALEQLLEGGAAIRHMASAPALRVQTYISFAICWLAHRLTHFRTLHPEIELRLATSGAGWDFDEDSADIGVIYRSEPIPAHLHWVKLFDSRFFPVCSPTLLADKATQLRPKDLAHYPLIAVNSEDRYWNWSQWFESAGLKMASRAVPIVVDTLAMSLEMAINGEGIALVNGPLADNDLRSGRLVKPVEHFAEGQGQWGIICRKEIQHDPRVVSLTNWLLEVSKT